MNPTESNWTENQSRALAFPDNLCVLAGAGSGKTKTLVELMVRLIQGKIPGMEPIDITNILALTYTEKAAREMRERVGKAITEKILEAKSADDQKFWTEQRRLLDRAQISTIHGFCLWVLRQFCLEAELDAEFGILDADPDFLRQASREALLDLVQAEDTDLLSLIPYFPFSSKGDNPSLDRQLSRIIGHYRTFGRFVRSDGPPPVSLTPHVEAMGKAAQMAEDMLIAREITENKGYFATILQFVETWRQIERNYSEDYLLDRLRVLESLASQNWYKAKNANQPARVALAAIKGERDRRRAQPIRENLIALSRNVERRIESEKKRRQLLDFDDLLLLTRDLLAGNLEIRRKLKDRYAVVLVDEFQDTNRLQADIIALLVESKDSERILGDPSESLSSLNIAPRRLVILGDPKQSIYRFRGAEVEVFEDIRRRFMSGMVGSSDGMTSGRTVALDRNFRSRPELVRFFNRLFLFVAEQCPPIDFSYGPEDRQSVYRPECSQSPPVLLLDTPAGGNVKNDRELEAAAIACYLQGMLNGSVAVRVGDEGNAPTPGDITILLRRFTHLKVYENALRGLGIPFYTVRGKGFYQCQEVWDLINVIFFLSDPRDGSALLGVLRSPLIGLSDEIITRLVWPKDQDGPKPLGDYFGSQPAQLPPELASNPTVQAAQNLLSRLNRAAGFALPAELLEIIIEQTQYLPVLLAQPQGDQKAANVQRLIEIVRNIPPRAPFAARELARFFKARIEDTQEDPEAQTGMEGQGAVQIMTIHQAKGLEFPIVVVPDIEQKPRTDTRSIIFGPDDELAIRFRDLDTQEEYRPTDFQTYLEAAKEKDGAESLRLLYVAATRARDHLVFSGCLSDLKETGTAKSWAVYLKAFADAHPSMLPVNAIQNSCAEDSGIEIVQPGVSASPPEECASNDRETEATEILNRVWDRPPRRPSVVQIDITGLTLYLTCPRRFHLERILGMNGYFDKNEVTDSPKGLRPIDRGNIYHYIMESLDLLDIPDESKLAELAFRGARIQGVMIESNGDAIEISRKIIGFLSHEWGWDLIKTCRSGGLILRETPILIKHPPKAEGDSGLILSGTIDMFYIAPDGEARLVDYKYARPKDAGRYTPQVQSYALGLIRSGISRKLRAGLYFAGDLNGTLVEIPLNDGWMENFQATLSDAARGLAELEIGNAPPDMIACPDPTCGFRSVCDIP